MAESGKATSPFAEKVGNPYRFGRQYVVFELLRLGHTRASLLSGLIEQEVLNQTQGETRDAKSLLDKVLHDLRHRKMIGVVIAEDGGYRLLPHGETGTSAQSKPDAGTKKEEVRESPPEPPADSADGETGREEDDVTAGDEAHREASSQRVPPDEAPYDPNDYTIHDVTDIYISSREALS